MPGLDVYSGGTHLGGEPWASVAGRCCPLKLEILGLRLSLLGCGEILLNTQLPMPTLS